MVRASKHGCKPTMGPPVSPAPSPSTAPRTSQRHAPTGVGGVNGRGCLCKYKVTFQGAGKGTKRQMQESARVVKP